jgi:hypothetical protein
MLIDGNCSGLIIITSPSDTGYRGRCNDPFANAACLITDEEKKKCEEGLFCCYFSELYTEYHYFCHRDIWRRFIKPHEDNLELILFCYLSDKKELVASGFFGDITSGSAYRDINAGRFVKDAEGDYRYIAGAQSRSARFPYDILLPKLNTISPAGFIRTVSDDEMISALKKAVSVIERIENSDDIAVIEEIEKAIEAISDTARDVPGGQYAGKTIVELADWLKEMLDETEEIPVTDLKVQVSELQDKAAATEDPRYFLVASKLQFLHGDYKYVLSLANFCYFYGHKLKKDRDYGNAKRAFVEAVKMYLLDPVEKKWKKDYIDKCAGEFLKLTAFEVADEYGEDLSFEDFFGIISKKSEPLEAYIPIEDLGRRTELQYYASNLERFWDKSDTEGYIKFFGENIIGRPFENSIKPILAARYYQLLAKGREQHGTDEALLEAAEYRRIAAEKQRNRNDGSLTVSAHEDLIEMNKDLALTAYQQNDLARFLECIGEAIDTARKVYETEPTRRRRENIYFLEGLKYRNLAKRPDFRVASESVAVADSLYGDTGIDALAPGDMDEKAFSIIFSDGTTTAFAEAMDITRARVREIEKAAAGAPVEGGGVQLHLMVSQALSFCLVDEVGEDELWRFIERISDCRKTSSRTLAVRIAELVAAWHLFRRFNMGAGGFTQSDLRSTVKKTLKDALGHSSVREDKGE